VPAEAVFVEAVPAEAPPEAEPEPIAETRVITPVAPSATEPVAGDVLAPPTQVPPQVSAGVDIQPGMDLPLPDPDAGPDAHDRLATLDLPGVGLGSLGEAIEFAAGTQNTTRPQPWSAVRVLLISGSRAGGASAGADPAEAERRVAQLEAGEGLLARLAGAAGADVAVLRVPESGAMEDGPVLDVATVDAALRQGWQLADAAGEDGRDALILASAGTGTDAAATAVLAATTGAEPVAVLPRVFVPGGRLDDNAWMLRCAAVRDALHRIRHEPRGAQDVLAQIGGYDLAVATGALLGAAARRMPVLLDGPVGVAAGLIARDLASQTRHWCLLPDAGTHALVRQGADVLGLTPVVELGLDLGEGANALAVLPLLRTAIGLASALPVHPALLAGHDDEGLAGDDPALQTGDDDEGLAGDDPALLAGDDEGLAGDDPATQDDRDNDRDAADGADADREDADRDDADRDDADYAEPEPDGPGPATTGG
jgi:NaMN:DMB phosphoribosyltransferase